MGIPGLTGLSAAGLPPSGDQANAVLAGTITAVGPQPAFAFRGPMNLAAWASVNTTLTTTAGSLSASVSSATGLANGVAIKSANLPAGSTMTALSGTSFTVAIPSRTHYGIFNPNNSTVTGAFATDRINGATLTLPQAAAEGVTLPASTTVTGVIQQYVAQNNAGGVTIPGIVSLSQVPSVTRTDPTPVPFLAAFTGNAVLVGGNDTAATFTGAAVTWSATIQLERSFDGGSTWVLCNLGSSGALAQWTTGPISLTFGEPEKQVLYRFNCISYSSGTINYRISQTGGAAESLAIGPLSGG